MMKKSRMMKNYLSLIYVMLLSICSFCFSCFGQQKKKETKKCDECDINVTLTTSEKIEQLTEKDIVCFLTGFDNTCSNNVEYSEFSNEILFRVVSKYPKEFLNILSTELINQEYIFSELSAPILDFNLEDIIKGVKSVKGESDIKERTLVSLQKALENQ